MDEVQAAVLSAKLRHLDHIGERRRQIARRYLDGIRLTEAVLPEVNTDSVWHIFALRHPQRDALRRHLADSGIGTMIHYPVPPHRERAYAEWNALSMPVAEGIAATELSLPCNTALTDDEVTRIVDAVNAFAAR